MEDLGTLMLEETVSEASGINERGEIAGSSGSESGGIHAFLRDTDGTLHDLWALDGFTSVALGINNAGEVAGESDTPAGETHAVAWRTEVIVDLGTLGGAFSQATAINDRFQIVGGSETRSGDFRAFMWDGGVMRDLGALGARVSAALPASTIMAKSSARATAERSCETMALSMILGHWATSARRLALTIVATSSATVLGPLGSTRCSGRR